MLRAAAYQYQFYEMAHAALAPARAISDAAHFMFRNPFNPFSATRRSARTSPRAPNCSSG